MTERAELIDRFVTTNRIERVPTVQPGAAPRCREPARWKHRDNLQTESDADEQVIYLCARHARAYVTIYAGEDADIEFSDLERVRDHTDGL